MGGTVLGAAAVMVIPRPSTPQQVAIAGNSGAIKAKHASKANGSAATPPAQTTTTAAAPKPKPKPKPAAPTTKTVVGSLVSLSSAHLVYWINAGTFLFSAVLLVRIPARLLQSEQGNILWACISLLDEETVAQIERLGGIKAIAISPPH